MNVKTVETGRMSTEEAEEVMRMWQERQTDRIAVTDLAEALAAPEDELATLLQQVRARTNDMVMETVKPPRITMTGILSVSGMAMCSLIAVIVLSAALGPPGRTDDSFLYLFCGLSFAFVPLATYALHRHRRLQIDEEQDTQRFLFKVQRQRP